MVKKRDPVEASYPCDELSMCRTVPFSTRMDNEQLFIQKTDTPYICVCVCNTMKDENIPLN